MEAGTSSQPTNARRLSNPIDAQTSEFNPGPAHPHDRAVAAQPPLLGVGAAVHMGEAPAAGAGASATGALGARLRLPHHPQLQVKHLRQFKHRVGRGELKRWGRACEGVRRLAAAGSGAWGGGAHTP